MLNGKCHCGAVHWTFDGMPEEATACNCTICRRYGVLWIYDFEGEKITVTGETSRYVWGDEDIGFHFCPSCGCVAYWRATKLRPTGQRRIAVNIRMSEPDTVGAIPIRHFDGLVDFADLPSDGKCVSDIWA